MNHQKISIVTSDEWFSISDILYKEDISYGLRGGEDYEKDTFRNIVVLTPGMLEK